MSSITKALKTRFGENDVPVPEFILPVVFEQRILELFNGNTVNHSTKLIDEAAQAVSLVSHFEDQVEYVDFYPQILPDKMWPTALRIKLANGVSEPVVLIDFPGSSKEGQ